jgi:hypothetical protein
MRRSLDPRRGQPRRPTFGATATALALVWAALGGIADAGPAKQRGCKRCTSPPSQATWWYQLQGRPSHLRAGVVDVDGFDTSSRFVSRLRASGRYAICYIDVGTWENWRRDTESFPDSVLGRGNGWPGERWLDLRRIDVLGPIMRARMRICSAKGFQAVEPDNVDGFENETGYSISARDQLAYNRWIAKTAHSLGLAVALKNDFDQIPSLARYFDFVIAEQCFELDECGKLRPFTSAGKAVFDVEYALPRSRFCSAAQKLHISALWARPSLNGAARPC